MKPIIIALLLCGINYCSFSQSAFYSWHHQVNGSGYDSHDKIALMPNNDLITCGHTSDLTDFDPSANTFLLDATHGINFFARYSASGQLIWAVNFDSTSYLNFEDLLSDGGNYFYVNGHLNGLADMDPSPDTAFINSGGSQKMFIAKYNAQNGNLVWVRLFNYPSYSNNLSLSTNGTIYISGIFSNSFDANPNAGTFMLTSIQYSDFYVAKFDTALNFIDAISFGSSYNDQLGGMSLDQQNNLFLTGVYRDTCDFNPGLGTYSLNATIPTAFLLKLDSNLQFIKVIEFSGNTTASFNKLITDKNNNLLLGGSMSYGTIDLDGGPGIANVSFPPSSAQPHIFTRQDTALNYLSGFLIPTDASFTNSVLLKDIAADTYNNIYVYWNFAYDINVDTATSTTIYSSVNDSYDMMIAKYTPSGQHLWSNQIGSPLDEDGRNILIGLNTKMYLTAAFKSQIDIDPTASQLIITNTGFPGSDGLLLSYNQCLPIVNNISASICYGQFYVFDTDTLTISGVYSNLFTSSNYCDSLVNLTLHVINPVIDVCLSDTTIGSNALNATYQWINCSNYSLILGATNQTYQVPDNNGYAVIVTQSGCVDTSACIQLYQNANSLAPVFNWAHVMPYKQYDGNEIVRISKKGNIYVAGYISDTANMDLLGGTSHYLDGVNGHQYAVIGKYDKNRNYEWAFAVGSPTSSGPYPEVFTEAITLDSAENIYVTGRYSETFDIDPGPNIVTMANNGTQYLAKYNTSGQFLWANTFVTTGNFESSTVFVDNSGHVYLGGNMGGLMTVYTPVNSTSINATGVLHQMVLMQFDANTGEAFWHYNPTPGGLFCDNEVVNGTCDYNGNIIITGTYECGTDFDPDTGVVILTPPTGTNTDAFVAKLTPNRQLLWAKKKNGYCVDATYFGNYGVVTDCDNTIYACGSCSGGYVDVYSDSGILINTFGNFGIRSFGRDIAIDEKNNLFVLSNFSDSCIIGHDTIYSMGTSHDFVFSKFHQDGSYAWSVNLGSSGLDYGNAIDVDKEGNIFVKGIIQDTMDADFDTLYTHNLTTTYSRPFLLKYGQSCAPVDTAMINDSTHLSAQNTASYYNWIDCTTGMLVPGQHGASLTAPATGYYQAIIYQGQCIDTSSCYFVLVNVGIKEHGILNAFVYPNPNNGNQLFIRANEELTQASIHTLVGTIIREETIPSSPNFEINLNGLSQGVYLITLKSANGNSSVKRIIVMRNN